MSAIGQAVGPCDKPLVCLRVQRIVKVVQIVFAILWGLASLSIYMAFLMPTGVAPELKRILKLIGNYHLGVFLYMGMALILVLLCRLIELICCKLRGRPVRKNLRIFHIRRSVLGVLYVAFVVIITLFGVHKAGGIRTNYYDISIHKQVKMEAAGEQSGSNNATDGSRDATDESPEGDQDLQELRIVMVADLHLGYNIGCEQMEKMVSLINAERPDVVLIAGDIFDNEYEALDDPDRLKQLLSSIESTYGTYAVYGNHDISERIIGGFTFNWKDPGKGSAPEMDEFLADCGIMLLRDEYVCLGDAIYIYGRPDYEKPGNDIAVRKSPAEITADLNLDKPIIVVDHEPRELQELADAGVDLDLCGHTHDGQFFPMNLTSRYITWENSAGLLMKGDMANIVTSGVGLFGPNIRIGTQAEICSITVHFE